MSTPYKARVDIPIPDTMKHLPVWNGWVVPYFSIIYPDGTPDFKVVDESKRRHAIWERVCWICGTPVHDPGWISFIGGERSVGNRMFYDPGSHEECARYAAQVCPYLSGTKRLESDIGEERKKRIAEAGYTVAETGVVRPRRMAIYTCKTYHTVKYGNHLLIAVPKKPRKLDWDIMPESDKWNFAE